MSKAHNLHERIDELEAEAAALREVLEEAECGPLDYCMFCGNHQDDGHRPDCSRQNALAADAGRELLERLRRAERERDEALEAYTGLSQAFDELVTAAKARQAKVW